MILYFNTDSIIKTYMYNVLFLRNNLTFKIHFDTEKVPYFQVNLRGYERGWDGKESQYDFRNTNYQVWVN